MLNIVVHAQASITDMKLIQLRSDPDPRRQLLYVETVGMF